MRPNKGAKLLLEILGGLLVVLLFHHGDKIVNYMEKASNRELTGDHTLLFWFAYVGYVANVFRQVHGLAVALEDTRYENVLKHLSRAAQISSFFCLIFVLTFPCLLVVHVELVSADPKFGQASPFWILGAYMANMIVYGIWDLITLIQVRRACRVGLCNDAADQLAAAEYKRFVTCWLALIGLTLIVGVIIIVSFMSPQLLTLSVHGAGWLSTPTRQSLPVCLIVLTFGYTVLDYVLNSKFYFEELPVSGPTSQTKPSTV